ncbi:hypothetical protein BAUCODRAFT_217301 [Baudoinia panamericana UAMH 10762]|uniref:Cyanovirin-N domain-containing protein n=1 Tax=Baudoinia panamericana (strain UAMH 10762) TaxID=717646 RepID=M2LIK0_BAUPA|nr:uncharacterized protein BAUCODRAFT_217301 [Baudoinia panamericana UAMH 10762]EMC93987.1 hypothetical protein BAUCODRAFT_217301 [Baudoinia panamericana UAMH 10762]
MLFIRWKAGLLCGLRAGHPVTYPDAKTGGSAIPKYRCDPWWHRDNEHNGECNRLNSNLLWCTCGPLRLLTSYVVLRVTD